jgi:succinyl-CoA synthetase beta subunit
MILPEHEANRLLAAAGIPMIPLKTVDSVDEAKTAAAALGYPVVLKLSSSQYTHKTEVGGVCLNLTNETDVADAFAKLQELREQLDRRASIILEPMAPAGAEFFIGFQYHPQFGPVLSIGFGGISLELFQDVAFRLLPAKTADFREMLSELKSWPKLQKGFRNLPPVDETQVLDLMARIAEVALSQPGLRELDLNPVVVRSDGAMVVDATIILDEDAGRTPR